MLASAPTSPAPGQWGRRAHGVTDRDQTGQHRPTREVELSDRAAIRRLMDQTDPRGVLKGLAGLFAEIDTRVGQLYGAMEVAAGMDPAARDLVEESQRRRLDDARKVVRRLRDLDALTAGITYQEAVDLVWLAMDPALFDRLVRARRWTTRRFEEWLADTLCRQLLR